MREKEADFPVRIEPRDLGVYPIGSDRPVNPYGQRRGANRRLFRHHQRPFRLMLINDAPILRRPSGASNWRLDRFFTTSQRGEALRSSARCIIGHPEYEKCWRLKLDIHPLI